MSRKVLVHGGKILEAIEKAENILSDAGIFLYEISNQIRMNCTIHGKELEFILIDTESGKYGTNFPRYCDSEKFVLVE